MAQISRKGNKTACSGELNEHCSHPAFETTVIVAGGLCPLHFSLWRRVLPSQRGLAPNTQEKRVTENKTGKEWSVCGSSVQPWGIFFSMKPGCVNWVLCIWPLLFLKKARFQSYIEPWNIELVLYFTVHWKDGVLVSCAFIAQAEFEGWKPPFLLSSRFHSYQKKGERDRENIISFMDI